MDSTNTIKLDLEKGTTDNSECEFYMSDDDSVLSIDNSIISDSISPTLPTITDCKPKFSKQTNIVTTDHSKTTE